MAPSTTTAALEREISALTDLTRSELVARWQSCYRTDPPKGISRPLLVRAIAYEMQVKTTRGLKPAAKRRLQAPGDMRDPLKLRVGQTLSRVLSPPSYSQPRRSFSGALSGGRPRVGRGPKGRTRR